MKFAYLILYFFVVGCAGKVITDPVLPAIEANYPTAEFRACGNHWLGSGVCKIQEGLKYSDIDLQVQVYYSGTLSVISTDCQLDIQLTYNVTQLIPITIPGTAEKDCLISITVSPQYPNNEVDPVRVYSFRGQLAIRKLKAGKKWYGFTRKVTSNFSSDVNLWIGGTNPVRLVANGCGRKDSLDVKSELVNGYLIFDIASIVPEETFPKTCVITGFVRSEYPDVLFNILVSKYDSRFVPLPIPAIESEKNNIKITGDKTVSVIGLNNDFNIDNKSDFSIDFNNENFIRLLTTSGRSVLGIWNVRTQSWSWKQ